MEQIDVAVIGAGQAGLATSHHLRAFGVEHVVLERNRIGETWRSSRWDSFTLVTPDWMTRLPGRASKPGAATQFLAKDELVAELERFADDLPVRTGVDVVSVSAKAGGYCLQTKRDQIQARAVVIAGGGLRRPIIPTLASRLPTSLRQLDAGQYRNPDALPPGAVLVVGGGQSGTQIAAELAGAGRKVFLATSKVARVPRRYRGRDVHEWGVELGLYDQVVEQITEPRQLREAHPMLSGARGGHTVALQQLARDGVHLLGRLTDVSEAKLSFGADLGDNLRYGDERAAGFRRMVDEYIVRAGIVAPPAEPDLAECPWSDSDSSSVVLDLYVEQIHSVIWCTGFGPDLAWLKVPVLTHEGTVAHIRGITAFSGLYVVGHPWVSNRGSGILYGVDADARRVAQHVAAARSTIDSRN